MRTIFIFLAFCQFLFVDAQIKLHLDSALKKSYELKYPFSDGLMCIPFYCDPFYDHLYKKADTNGLCGRFVFVNRQYEVKVKTTFELPCWFEPKFSEGLAAVNIDRRIVFIDTNGRIVFKTDLLACSPQKNRVLPFKNGRAKVYHGGNSLKHYYEVYFIDKQGKRIKEQIFVRVKQKGELPVPALATRNSIPVYFPDLPKSFSRGKYPLDDENLQILLNTKSHKNNRLLLYFNCGTYQYENMDIRDTIFCGQFVFTDTLLNVKIGGGFKLPCAFEPEFSEGLAAVSVDSMIVFIDVLGNVKIRTGLKSCSPENNKVSTFRNGIATLYQGDPNVKGLYKTSAINTLGERVRLLEFDELELAELKFQLFKNLSREEAVNCFVGKGKSNGLWFLIEKSGKVRKKLEPIPQ